MKIRSAIKLLIILAITVSLSPVYAKDDIAVNKGGVIYVEGKTDSGKAGETVTMAIMQKDKTAEDLFSLTNYADIGSIVINIQGKVTTAGGQYSFTARTDENYQDGNYNIIVDGDGMTEPKLLSVYCYSLSAITEFISELNGGSDSDAVTLRVQANAGMLGLKISDYNKLNISGKSFANGRIMGKAYNTTDAIGALQQVKLDLEAGIALMLMNEASSEAEVKYVVENYNEYLNLDLYVYDKFAGNITELCSRLYPLEINEVSSFQETFKRESIITFLRTGSLSGALRDVIEKYSGDIGIDISAGSDYQSADSIKLYKEFMKSRSFNDYAGLKKAINSAISKATNVDPPSSGGGGGSGKVNENYSVSVPIVPVTPPSVPAVKPSGFEDTANHWAKDSIDFMYGKGYINGYDEKTFAPDAQISRAQFVAIISRVLGLSQTIGNVFEDVSDEWFASDVSKAVAAGLISSQSEQFRPNDFITREELMKIVVNAYKYKNKNYTILEQQLNFADKEGISDWALEFVSSAVELGLVKGIEEDGATYIKPNANTTRAEAATILKRLTEALPSL